MRKEDDFGRNIRGAKNTYLEVDSTQKDFTITRKSTVCVETKSDDESDS